MILAKEVFNTHFKPLGYKNARNAASGCARDKKGDLLKHIELVAFDLDATSPLEHMTNEHVKEKFARSMGLSYVDCEYMVIDRVWPYFEQFDRASLPYEIDGLVVKICDIPTQEQFGVVDNRPKGQLALKWQGEQAKTEIIDVTWQVGLSGHITPVAELAPVDIGGSTIRRCTLNNIDYIKALGVAIGDTVLIEKANDVIPKMISVVSHGATRRDIPIPDMCPSCDNPLERDGAYLICPHIECAGAVFGDMMTWIKTHKMIGFGRTIISELIDRGITTPDQLYTTTDDMLAAASGSHKIAAKLRAIINKTRQMTVDQLLAGLNIPHLGKTNAKRIAKKLPDIRSILDATVEDLSGIAGIKTTAKKILQGIATKRDLIQKLLEHITIISNSGPLAGKSFAMTGLRSYDGHDLSELISRHGGEVKSGVSKELDYLIIKDPNSTSNKANKARRYGTTLISPEQFMAMIGV